ncbi:MAG: RNA polymerase sigma factor [Bacteroidetes bacterium]|nr:RNA polymerase sigma factor [Bacteroidota bacterium]
MKIDPELLVRCQKDERKAVEQLYEFCFHLLMPSCFQYHKNEEDARSSLNLGFVKIIKALKKVELEGFNFIAWSRRIMNNTLIDEYRKEKKHKSRQTITDDDQQLEYYSEGVINASESNLGEQNILELLDELPELTKNVFVLYVIEGYAHKEIAEILGIAEGTSKWHLSSGRKTLREKLELLEMKAKKMVV